MNGFNFTKIYTKDVASLTGMSEPTIRNYVAKEILFWHEKDKQTGRKNVFFSECVTIRWELFEELRRIGNSNKKIKEILNKALGLKDEALQKKFDKKNANYEAIKESVKKNILNNQ